MTQRRDHELAQLKQLATLRSTHAQAAVAKMDLKISAIQARIDVVKAPLTEPPTDMVAAFAADRWVAARATHVARLNSELARERASRVGAAEDAARAAAVEDVMDDTLRIEKQSSARSRIRRSEERMTDRKKRP